MSSTRLGKSLNDWIIATYCDYGKNEKIIIRRHYAKESAARDFIKLYRSFNNKGKFKVWQETKNGKLIKNINKKKRKKYEATTYCDYGDITTKIVLKQHFTIQTAKKEFKKILSSFTNKGRWRCWQEIKTGVVINDSKK